MARGTQLGTLVSRLRSRILDSPNTNLGQNYKHVLVAALQASQAWLYQDYSWSFLRKRGYKDVAAGSRYYDVPTGIPIESILEVRYYWNGRWSDPLERGITMRDYNSRNSDNDERADPVLKWDMIDNSGAAQVEIWPLATVNTTGGLLVVGKRALVAFEVDSDVCDLDDELLLRWARADILEGRGAENAPQARAQATTYYNKFKGNNQRGNTVASFAPGVNQPENLASQKPPIVVYAR